MTQKRTSSVSPTTKIIIITYEPNTYMPITIPSPNQIPKNQLAHQLPKKRHPARLINTYYICIHLAKPTHHKNHHPNLATLYTIRVR